MLRTKLEKELNKKM